MTGLPVLAMLAALAASSAAQPSAIQPTAADSVRALAMLADAPALVTEAQRRPLVVREALAEALARAVNGRGQSVREAELVAARRLAGAYALAWRDSFLIREVERFAAWPPERRAAKVWSDSARRAGIAAYAQIGAHAAIRIWRRALARAVVNEDSSGMAAVLGNIGAGFLREGSLDSAARYLERARTLASQVGDVRVEANAVGALAAVSEDRGDLAGARERYSRALALRDRIGDTRGAAADHNNLGLLAQSLGDLDGARRAFETALALNRRDRRAEVGATNLVNLAGLASLEGDFARSEALYRDALAIWRERGMWVDAADALRGLGQLELRRGDYPAARAALLEAVAIYDRTGPLTTAIDARREVAVAHAAAGNLQGALDELRRAQSTADSARAPPAIRAALGLARADLAVQFNALAEAERLFSRAEVLYRQAGDPGGEAEAREGRGLLLLERDDFASAQALLESALRTQDAAANRRSAALTRLALGQLARQRGDTAAARRLMARAVLELDRLADPVATAAALGEQGALAAEMDLPVTAEALYRAALDRMAGKTAPDIQWRLHAGLAEVQLARANTNAAVRELRTAIAVLEGPTRSLVMAERRSGFLADKWDVYARLALIERRRGRSGAAFEASERLRAREMLELLSRGRLAAPSDTAAELVAREQDLRRRLAELSRAAQVNDAGSEPLRGAGPSGATGSAREALVRTEAAYAALLLEMRERAPRHAALLAPETATWRDVARRLAPGEVLIEYLLSDSGSLAFVVSRDTVVALELGVRRQELVRMVEFARGTLGPAAPSRSDSLWRGPLRRLHQYLIAPVEQAGFLAGKTRLVLVPHAELHYLPFAALVDGRRGQFLVERYELTYTPSASVWLALGERAPNRPTAGLLAFAPRPDALPGSEREVAAIARSVGSRSRVLVGTDASELAFRRDAGAYRVLHLATFGVLNKHNPLFSFVELAAGGAHNGRLEVHEVFGLRVSADLVVLSACQTGLGSGALRDVPAGDDWVGLTRAFLHAGAERVVATLWPVADWATADLMERFYNGYSPGSDAPGALAAAQRALLAAPSTAHPFYWAGFVVVGGANDRNTGEGR